MTDPITYSNVAASYTPFQSIQRTVITAKREEQVSQAQDNAMAKALYRFNAQLIETSSEIFAQNFASNDEMASSDVMSTLAQGNDIQDQAFNAQIKSEYLGNNLDLVA